MAHALPGRPSDGKVAKGILAELFRWVHGMHGGRAPDALSDYPTPASGSYHLAPSVDALGAGLG